jgi:uncharacterized tellurite resistance protein B-like protein
MAGFLDKFRKKVVFSIDKGEEEECSVKDIDDKIALGVLLWVVAEADNKFLPEEEEKIKEILLSYSKIPEGDIPLVLKSIKAAAEERIDLYQFTNEVSKDLSYPIKISIIDNLFRVACADRELDNNEVEVIRKIAGLFFISHKDFIGSKIRIKKEFGLDTAGL